MRKLLGLLALTLLLNCGPAWALGGCTSHGTVTAASTPVANQFTPGRHYFMIQNTGATNNMYVALASGGGSSVTATTSDMLLIPGNAWVMSVEGGSGGGAGGYLVPGGAVAAITSTSTTSFAFCEW